MNALAFFFKVIIGCIYLIAAVIAFVVTSPFQLYNFSRWFLDSRYTPRK
jgi:hypothetical protein